MIILDENAVRKLLHMKDLIPAMASWSILTPLSVLLGLTLGLSWMAHTSIPRWAAKAGTIVRSMSSPSKGSDAVTSDG